MTTYCKWDEGLRRPPSVYCFGRIEAIATPIELAPLLLVCGHAIAVTGSAQVLHEDSASSPSSPWHGGQGWRRGTYTSSSFSSGVGHNYGPDLQILTKPCGSTWLRVLHRTTREPDVASNPRSGSLGPRY
uniref:Uncharacterized protein n=1 Tax=Oryza glumipatula TaxID=40148 RepID=A0A0E0AQZ0_9ORYZ